MPRRRSIRTINGLVILPSTLSVVGLSVLANASGCYKGDPGYGLPTSDPTSITETVRGVSSGNTKDAEPDK